MTGVESKETLPREVELLATGLSNIHGHVVVRRERGGLQLYMACPNCLQRDGKKELAKKHLSVNPERYLALGKWKQLQGTYNADASGYCMKESKIINVTDLKSMVPLQRRGYPDAPTGVTKPAEGKCIIDDGKGNMIPDHPGQVVPITQLPADHPGVTYLVNRGYDLQRLWDQFRCSWCWQEAPENPEMDRFYRRLPCEFRDTPQNRIIFYADVNGVQRGWQARIIEHVAGDTKFFLHPYDNQWYPMEIKVNGKWVPNPPYTEGQRYQWNYSKYKTAFSSKRNEMLMGWDAAIAQASRWPVRLIIPSEGPLDAGRFGPGSVPLLGKYLSPDQARMIMTHFTHVLFAQQNDKVSEGLEREMSASFLGRVIYSPMKPPPSFKDFGEMSDAGAWDVAHTVLQKTMGVTL